MSSRSILPLLATLSLLPAAAAHDGHGEPSLRHSAWHWLLEPAHLPLTLGAVALVAGGAWLLLRRRAVRVRGDESPTSRGIRGPSASE